MAVDFGLRFSWCPNIKGFILTLNEQHQLNVFLFVCFSFSCVFCLFFSSSQFVEGAGSLPWPGGSATKPGKPKGKKKISSVRQKFDVSLCGSL